MLFASAAALGFNAPSAMRPMGRTCAPTMGEAEDLQLLVSRFGPTSQEQQHSRRSALQLGAAAMGATALAGFVSPAQAADGMFSLPPLPYAYVSSSHPNHFSSRSRTPLLSTVAAPAQDALEPHIDAATMKFHHDFHHQAYINNLNKASPPRP